MITETATVAPLMHTLITESAELAHTVHRRITERAKPPHVVRGPLTERAPLVDTSATSHRMPVARQLERKTGRARVATSAVDAFRRRTLSPFAKRVLNPPGI